MDQQRIALIAQKYFKENGTAATTLNDFLNLQGGLNNAIVNEYPGLDPNLRFNITGVERGHADGPREVDVEISQAVGKVTLRIPS